MRVCVPGAECFFESQTIYSFLSFDEGIYNFEESPKSIQDVIGDVYCQSECLFNSENSESLYG